MARMSRGVDILKLALVSRAGTASTSRSLPRKRRYLGTSKVRLMFLTASQKQLQRVHSTGPTAATGRATYNCKRQWIAATELVTKATPVES